MEDIKCAFVTGGTGLLGVNIVRELIQNTTAKIFLLVRNLTKEKKDRFFRDLLGFGAGLWPVGFSFRRIRFIEGDVSKPYMGISSRQRSELYKEIDIIYHSAAVIKLSGAEAEVRAANTEGTRNLLDFAVRCKERGRLDRVIHVSTVGVAGDYEGEFRETDLDVGQGFNNPYERSKFEGEKIVQEYRDKGLNVIIVRPSMVIGHSHTGYTNHYNMFYFQLRLLADAVIDVMPVREDASYNIVPADYAGRAIYLISKTNGLYNQNFHIVNTHEVNVRDFIKQTCRYLGWKMPRMVSPEPLATQWDGLFSGMRGKVLGIYYPYINKKKDFMQTMHSRYSICTASIGHA